jgi:polyhydroxyalkanoate synthesis repressor PhaR
MAVIKRYSNRKLYDTESKHYVTLEELAGMVRHGEDVRVVDHNTGEDLTSVTLMQVIFEEEKKIGGMLPQMFLTRLIRSGGEAMTALRSRVSRLDPFQVVDDEIGRRVERLVRAGKLDDAEGARILQLLTSDAKEDAAVRIAVPNEEAAAEEPLADLAAVELLEQQVELLEQELARLKYGTPAEDTLTAP